MFIRTSEITLNPKRERVIEVDVKLTENSSMVFELTHSELRSLGIQIDKAVNKISTMDNVSLTK